jgi:hypothetical protein
MEMEHRFKPNGITDNRDEWKQKWADTVYEYSFTTYWEGLNTKRRKAICKYMITGEKNWRVNDSEWIYSDGYNPQKAGELLTVDDKTPHLGNTDFGFN